MSESELREIMDDTTISLGQDELVLVMNALSTRIRKCKQVIRQKGGGVSPAYWQSQLIESINLQKRLCAA